MKARAYEKRGWKPRLLGSGLTRRKLRLPDSFFTRRRALKARTLRSARLETAPTGFVLSYARVWQACAYEKRDWKLRLPVSRVLCVRGWKPRLPGSGLTRWKLRLLDSFFTRRRAIRSLLVGALFVLYS